jgi:hypothetical protein
MDLNPSLHTEEDKPILMIAVDGENKTTKKPENHPKRSELASYKTADKEKNEFEFE